MPTPFIINIQGVGGGPNSPCKRLWQSSPLLLFEIQRFLNEAFSLMGNQMIERNVWSGYRQASWEGMSLRPHGQESTPFQTPGRRAIDNLSGRHLAYLTLFIRASFEEEEIRSIPGLVQTSSDMFMRALVHFPHVRSPLIPHSFPWPIARKAYQLEGQGVRF